MEKWTGKASELGKLIPMDSQATANIDELLAALGENGDFHSNGRFTLDYERSKLLLERFQLPTPAHFVYCLIAAACLSFPTEVQIALKPDGIEITFDGRPFGQDELEQASGSLFLSSRGADVIRLQELAIGMAGATRWKANLFEVNNISGRSRIQVSKGGLLTRLKGVFGRFGYAFDESELREHLASSPNCRLLLNQHLVPEVLAPKSCLIYSHLGGQDTEPGFQSLLPHLRELSTGLFLQQEPNDSHHDQILVFMDSQVGDQRSTTPRFELGIMTVVLNGRQFKHDLPGRLKHIQMIVYCHNLKKDLSQQALASAEVDHLVNTLERHQLAQLEHLSKIWSSLKDHQLKLAIQWVLFEWSHCHLWYKDWPQVAESYLDIFLNLPMLTIVGEQTPVSFRQLRDETQPFKNGEQRTRQKNYYFTMQTHWEHPARNGTRTMCLPDSRLVELIKTELTGNKILATGETILENLELNDWDLSTTAEAFRTRDQFFQREPGTLQIRGNCWCTVELDPELDQGWVGQLGLAHTGGPLGRVTLCHLSRAVCEITLTQLDGYPDILVGILENPGLNPNFDCTSFEVDSPEQTKPPLSAVTRLLSSAIDLYQNSAGSMGTTFNVESDELRRALVVGLLHAKADSNLASLKLFELASKIDNQNERDLVSYEELLSRRSPQGTICLSRRRFEVVSISGQWVLLQEGWLEPLSSLLFGETENIEIPLRIQEKRGRTLKTWLASERLQPKLDAIPQLITKVGVRDTQQTEPNLVGEIGCGASSALAPTRIHFLSDGRSLGIQLAPTAEECSQNSLLRLLPTGLRAIINSPTLVPNEDCSGALPDQNWVACIRALWETLPKLALELVPVLRQRSIPLRTTQLHFFQLLSCTRLSLDPAQLPTELMGLLDAACLNSLDGTVETIGQLLNWCEGQVKPVTVYYLCEPTPPPHIEGLPLILWFDTATIEVFQTLLHQIQFENAEGIYLEALYQQEQQSRELEKPQLPLGTIAARSVQSECGYSGLVGLLADSQIPEGHFKLRLLSDGKLVEQFVIEESSALVSQVGKLTKPAVDLSVRRQDYTLRAVVSLEKAGVHHPLPADLPQVICNLLKPEFDQLGIELYLELLKCEQDSTSTLKKTEPRLLKSLQDYLICRFPAASHGRDPKKPSLSHQSRRVEQLDALPLFRSNRGEFVSMERLHQELESENRILYTFNETTSIPPETFVLHTHRTQLTSLKMILGGTAFAEASKLERAYQAKDSFYSRPVQSLTLPEFNYLKVWEFTGKSDDQQSPRFSYRAMVGLHPNTDWTSNYNVYFDGRIIETLRQAHPFSMEASVEIEGLRIHQNYRGFERDEVFEAVVQHLESQVNQLILSQLSSDFHLKIIVEGSPSDFWPNLKLLRDTQGNRHSVNDLKSSQGPTTTTYYWPSSQETLNPETLPLGTVPLVLDASEVALLSKTLSRLESIEHSVLAATTHLRQMEVFPEIPSAKPELLQALHGSGRAWWLSDLTSDHQTLSIYWKKRLLRRYQQQAWPGYVGHIDCSEQLLDIQGEISDQVVRQSLTNSAEIVTSHWLALNDSGELSLEHCKQCLEFVGISGLLQNAIRKRLGVANFLGYSGWELEVVSKILTRLQTLHQQESLQLKFESLDRLCSFHHSNDGNLVYTINDNLEARQQIDSLSPNWLLTTLWNEFQSIQDPILKRQSHLEFVKALLNGPEIERS